MCDTLIALPTATADGSLLFAKNSDRDPNEAHELVQFPRTQHPTGSMVQCTYIAIPQAAETHAVLLAKPFWIWGAEMGANEHGVVIGNEAVFTKMGQAKKPALLGMDLLRLGLERGATARQALEVITSLLAEYGQGGNCGFAHKLFYDNSFIIADPQEAWVLETAGREWAAERVQSVRSISNAITIGKEWDLASPNLVETAVARGWCKGAADFDFGRCYSDTLYTTFSDAHSRFCRTRDGLEGDHGRLSVRSMMNHLRDHGPAGEAANWTPAAKLMGATVCMHAGFGPVRVSQTTGSMVSQLRGNQHTHWFTATAAPCLSLFKPVWLGAGLPELEPAPTGQYDPSTLWWRHEDLHRAVLRDYATYVPLITAERDAQEAAWVATAAELATAPPEQQTEFMAHCWAEGERLLAKWHGAVKQTAAQHRRPWLHALAWRQLQKQAGRR